MCRPALAWVGFDVKAPFAEYEHITGVPGSGERALESLRLLVASGVPFEARTTVHPDLLGAEAIVRLAEDLAAVGVRHWVVQAFRPDGSQLAAPARAFSRSDVPERAVRLFDRFEFRGA